MRGAAVGGGSAGDAAAGNAKQTAVAIRNVRNDLVVNSLLS